MVTITLNGQILQVENHKTLLQVCQQQGIEVPHFCYHPRLSIAGNCRMCLVEIENVAKPVASCATPVSDGMVLHTNSPMVEKARQDVLEFLLINHPLDCPICDQGGECDLQDLTVNYGPPQGRFDLNKRAVTDKYMGPLIKTVMTRCIHCTRCIRFADEIVGVSELVALGRGETMEISNALNTAIQSELSGNMIDICPVGALTSKPYAFQGRSWEWKKTASVDVMDALGSAIRIDTRDREVMRIQPRLEESINQEWLSDRSRFSYDGLKYQRLDQPYLRRQGKLEPCSWEEAFQAIGQVLSTLKGEQIAALSGDLVDCESQLALKRLWQNLGSPHLDCRQDGSQIPFNHRCHYIANTTLVGLEQADCVLLVGTNPRHEAPLFNTRLRQAFLKQNAAFGLIGPKVELTYPYWAIGDQPLDLKLLLKEDHPFSQRLAYAQRPAIILGQAVFNNPDSASLLTVCQSLLDRYPFIQLNWNGYNVLHTAAARVGGLDVGFVPGPSGYATPDILKACQENTLKLVYLLGVDERQAGEFGKAFVIYQGHHGDVGAERADVILPGCAYTEKTATYVNTEGRAQRAVQAVSPPGQAKEDWRILTALSHALVACCPALNLKPLPYTTLEDVQKDLAHSHPAFQALGEILQNPWVPLPKTKATPFLTQGFDLPIKNFYMTNSITRSSPTMATCVQEILHNQRPKEVTSCIHC